MPLVNRLAPRVTALLFPALSEDIVTLASCSADLLETMLESIFSTIANNRSHTIVKNFVFEIERKVSFKIVSYTSDQRPSKTYSFP